MNEEKKTTNEEQKRNLRRRADGLVKAAWFFSIVSWLFAFAVLLVLGAAAPEQNWTVLPGVQQAARYVWDPAFLPVALGLLIASFVMCIVAFIFHSRRMKRKSDKTRTKSILIVGALTLAGLVAFLRIHGPAMFF